MPKAKARKKGPADIVIHYRAERLGHVFSDQRVRGPRLFCVDNMPLTLLPTFARLVGAQEDERGRIDRAALVISFREGRFLSDFAKQLRVLRKGGLGVSVIFFEAADEILARRFSETRRPHPADRAKDCSMRLPLSARR